jgi:hypothetical protein
MTIELAAVFGLIIVILIIIAARGGGRRHPADPKGFGALFSKPCPNCRTRINDRARVCPHCNQPTGFDKRSTRERLWQKPGRPGNEG